VQCATTQGQLETRLNMFSDMFCIPCITYYVASAIEHRCSKHGMG